MKLSDLCKDFDLHLEDIDLIILEQEGHTNRVRYIPPSATPHNYNTEQTFNEVIYPYITVHLKNGNILDMKIGKYTWMSNCPKVKGLIPK